MREHHLFVTIFHCQNLYGPYTHSGGDQCEIVNESTLQDFGAEISSGGVLLPLSVVRATRQLDAFGFSETP
jgi:hypothetical protein